MLNISKIRRRFFCKVGMVSLKYTIYRSNIKPIPFWADIMAIHNIARLVRAVGVEGTCHRKRV